MDSAALRAKRTRLYPRLQACIAHVGLVLCSAFAACANAVAAEVTETVAPQAAASSPASAGFSWGGYFYGLGALCLILALLYGALWIMRRSGKFRFMPAYGALPRDALRLEAQLPLGPRKGLMVVRFLNKRMLLGVTDQKITLLSEADTHDEQAGADFGKSLEEAARREVDA